MRYDLKPRTLFEKEYVGEIIKHVKSIEAANWQMQSPFGVTIPADNVIVQDEHVRFLERSTDYGRSDKWLQLVEETENAFDVMGIARSSWRVTGRFSEVIMKKSANNFKVRILLMHQDNPALLQFINNAMPESLYENVVHEIDMMVRYLSRISESCDNVEIRQILRGCLHGQLTRMDRFGVYIPYFYATRSPYAPLWQCERGSDLYDLLQHEFETLWQVNG